MPDPTTLERHRDEILRLAREHGAYNVRIFGSVARGQAGPTSDLDLLVAFEPGRSLLDLVGLKLDLEELLNCSVDIATDEGLHWTVRDGVLEEARSL